MINKTREEIKSVLNKFKNPVIAYSGGKDGFVVAHLCNEIYPNIKMICETSFYFPKQIQNIKEISSKYKFNVTFTDSLNDEWLKKNKEIIFTNDKKLRSFSFQIRHQSAIKKFVKKVNGDITIFGRRTEENTVPKKLYTTKNGYQFHPLREWLEQDIWNYFKLINEPKPFIYQTKFGKIEGNAPFYTLKRGSMSLSECWEIINEIDTEKIFFNKFNL